MDFELTNGKENMGIAAVAVALHILQTTTFPSNDLSIRTLGRRICSSTAIFPLGAKGY